MKVNVDFNKRVRDFKNRIVNQDELARERKKLAGFQYAAGITANLHGGNFYTGLLLLLNADDKFMGTLAMINITVGIVPILSAVILDRFEKRKKILIISRIITNILNILAIGILSVVKTDDSTKLSAILMITFISGCIANIAGPGFGVWHIRLIPKDKRAGFFSFMNVTSGIMNYLIVIISSSILDHFKALGYELQTILILRASALVFAAVEIILLMKIREYPNPGSGVRFNFFNIFKKAFRSGKYLYTVAIACMYGFVFNLQGPYFTVYLLKDLDLEYSFLSLVSLMYMPFMIFLTPVWKRIIQKTSWYKALLFCLIVNIPVHLIYPFTSISTVYIYPVASLVAYLASPGLSLIFSNNPYHNLPEQDQTELLGFYSTTYNLSALAGVSIGRWFIGATEDIRLNIFGFLLTNKQYIMFLVAIGVSIMSFIVYKTHRSDETASETDA